MLQNSLNLGFNNRNTLRNNKTVQKTPLTADYTVQILVKEKEIFHLQIMKDIFGSGPFSMVSRLRGNKNSLFFGPIVYTVNQLTYVKSMKSQSSSTKPRVPIE